MECAEPHSTAQSLTTACADIHRFGNEVTTGVLTAALAADGRGPGPVNTTISVTDGVVQVTYLARIAGTYTLTVISVATGQPLAGMPLQASQQSQALEYVPIV